MPARGGLRNAKNPLPVGGALCNAAVDTPAKLKPIPLMPDRSNTHPSADEPEDFNELAKEIESAIEALEKLGTELDANTGTEADDRERVWRIVANCFGPLPGAERLNRSILAAFRRLKAKREKRASNEAHFTHTSTKRPAS